MKLVVLIPAFNEEKKIAEVILKIPKKINGIDEVQILVINDGSDDKTLEMAFNGGADKIITHNTNLGVGAAFMTGIRNAISMNADIVVTLDADSQFDPAEIPELIIPIMNKQTDVVIGSRFYNKIPEDIPKIKAVGNKIFTKIISKLLNQKFTDTQTGFRAYSKDALLKISVVNNFTYTQEVLIDLKFKGVKIIEKPVKVKYEKNRKSRVVKSIGGYSINAISIIVKTIIFHRPILAFGMFGSTLIGLGVLGKLLTVSNILWVSSGLSTGFIVLGIVSFMIGMLANVVFKRQTFAEIDLRHYIDEIIKEQTKKD